MLAGRFRHLERAPDAATVPVGTRRVVRVGVGTPISQAGHAFTGQVSTAHLRLEPLRRAPDGSR